MENQDTALARVGEFAYLRVAAIEEVGTFLDWGLPKDLFLPYSEQTQPLRVGQGIVIYIDLDKLERPTATMRWEKYLHKTPANYKEGTEVSVLIAAKTELGYKAIINSEHLGLFYDNEVFRPLHIGDKVKAFTKKSRDDGKIDLILDDVGHKASADISEKILERLKENDGFLPIDDKTSPELIYEWFGVSKKKYKMALGGLYKKRLISIHDDGIRLVKS